MNTWNYSKHQSHVCDSLGWSNETWVAFVEYVEANGGHTGTGDGGSTITYDAMLLDEFRKSLEEDDDTEDAAA